MEHTARNYHAHGGSEWVVGGKLTFLPGATDSEAGTVAALREDFNRLLSALREAGVMTSAPDE